MIVPDSVTIPARLVTSHLRTSTECIRASDPGAALRWLEQASVELGHLLDALRDLPDPTRFDGLDAELLMLLGRLRGRLPGGADAETLQRVDALLNAAGIEQT